MWMIYKLYMLLFTLWPSGQGGEGGGGGSYLLEYLDEYANVCWGLVMMMLLC